VGQHHPKCRFVRGDHVEQRRIDALQSLDRVGRGDVAKEIAGIWHCAVEWGLDEKRVHAWEVPIRRRSRHQRFRRDILQSDLVALLHQSRSSGQQVLSRAALLVRPPRRVVEHRIQSCPSTSQ